MITGINADDENIMGDWSEPQPEENLWTVVRGLRTVLPQADIHFVDQGWDPQHMSPTQVARAEAEAEILSEINKNPREIGDFFSFLHKIYFFSKNY